jgi:hypothetical protein
MGMSEEWESILEMGRKDLRALEIFEYSKELAEEIFEFHAQQAYGKGVEGLDFTARRRISTDA